MVPARRASHVLPPALHGKAGMSARRLVLLFDGTWNRRQETTSVWRMRMMLRHDRGQRIFYDEGVGTAHGEVFTGGAFGSGLSAKLLNAYLWLMEEYEEAGESPTGLTDEIFVFGFSRGAFTARSLVGMLSIVGLLKGDAPSRVLDAFEFSRNESITEDSPMAVDFRRQYSREVIVKFLGVWDTVGALGIPRIKGLPRIRLRTLEDNAYHKVVHLPAIVSHARHAIALDEHRYIFDATLWPGAPNAQSMEQRWFAGAHANVGGGYENDGLFRRPLQWLQHEAGSFGLTFRQVVKDLGYVFYASAPRDSLDETGYGAYNLTQWLKPHYRLVSLGDSSDQSIDFTVLERWAWDPWYRPRSLEPYLPRNPRKRPSSTSLADREILDLVNNSNLTATTTRGFVIESNLVKGV